MKDRSQKLFPTNNKHLSSQFWKLGSPKSKHWQTWCLCGFLVHRHFPLTVSSHGGRDEGGLWVSFLRHQSHSWGLQSYDLITSQKPHGPKTIALGISFQHTNLRETQHSVNCKPEIRGEKMRHSIVGLGSRTDSRTQWPLLLRTQLNHFH